MIHKAARPPPSLATETWVIVYFMVLILVRGLRVRCKKVPSQYQQNKIQILKNEEINISHQDFHTVQNIFDTHVILDEEVKEEIFMQEE